MQAKFIRHYEYLEPPYDDWIKLNLKQYDDLASGRVDPSIRGDYEQYLIDNYSKSDYDIYELIITSSLKRAINTGRTIKETFGLDLNIINTPFLDEIFWSPLTMISEENFKKAQKEQKLNLYESRITQFLDGTAPRTVQDAFIQLEALEKLLLDRKESKVLCITSSFFLKMLGLYFLKGIKNKSAVTKEMLMNAVSQDFETVSSRKC